MDLQDQKFKVTLPAELLKSDDGEWRVYGLASTGSKDQQGEVVDLKGLDLTPIQKGRGVFNFDHKKGPENTVGAIDAYKVSDKGLYLGGYLFKGHDRAKALYQIMTSLKKSDKGRMGLSIEGVIKQRAGEEGRIIKKAVITSCALTMNPVNDETYVNLVKSLSGAEFESEVSISDDFIPEREESTQKATDSTQILPIGNNSATLFTVDQVIGLLQKALGVGAAYAQVPPGELSGGDALAQESIDKVEDAKEAKPKRKKKASEMDRVMLKSAMKEILDQLKTLYPEASKSELWEAVKNRVNKRFSDSLAE